MWGLDRGVWWVGGSYTEGGRAGWELSCGRPSLHSVAHCLAKSRSFRNRNVARQLNDVCVGRSFTEII